MSLEKDTKILQPDDNETSWNVPWAVDFFIAYGIYLAVVVSFSVNLLIGIGVRWMSRRSERERLGLEYMLQCCSRFSIKSQIFLFDDRNLLSLFVVIFLIHQASKVAPEPICESYSSQSLIMNNSLVRLMLFVSLASIRRFLAWLLNFTIFDNFKSRRMAKRMAVKSALYNRMGLEVGISHGVHLPFLAYAAHKI